MHATYSSLARKIVCPAISACMLALGGCAFTQMHSFVDPEFRGHTYERVVVAVQADQLDQRDDAETIFAKSISKLKITCIRGLDMFPPTRKFEDAEFAKALKDAKADGLVMVRMTQYYEDEYYTPPSTTTTTTGNLSANTYYSRNMAYTTGRTNSITRTMTTGGNTYKEPRIRHEVQLWDVQTGKMAWIGGTFTKGNTYAGFDNLVSSLADEVRRTLEKEGFIKLPPPRAQ